MYRNVYTIDAVPHVVVITRSPLSASQERLRCEPCPTVARHCCPSQAVLHLTPRVLNSSPDLLVEFDAWQNTGAWCILLEILLA